MDAGGSLALGDEGTSTLLRDDLEVVGATGVREIDGWRGPLSEDDGPLFLSHGEVLGVVVPGILSSCRWSSWATGRMKASSEGGRWFLDPRSVRAL